MVGHRYRLIHREPTCSKYECLIALNGQLYKADLEPWESKHFGDCIIKLSESRKETPVTKYIILPEVSVNSLHNPLFM